jgi:hypothetical protein
MKEFINIVLPVFSKFKNISISYGDKKNIQDAVMQSFGLSNLKLLRDKYEGVLFLDLFTNKIIGEIAVRKILKIDILDWDKIKPRNYKPKINFNGVNIKIITVKFGEFPVIEKINKVPAIFVINREDKEAFICGVADVDTLNLKNNVVKLKNIATKSSETQVNFIAFDKLKQFVNQEELLSILKELKNN